MNERANKSLRQTATHYFSLFISKLCAVKILVHFLDIQIKVSSVCVCVSERERERVTYRNTRLCWLHQVCSGSLSENHNRPETMKDKTRIEYYLGPLYRKYWSNFSAEK
jgi:hypothetical protein